jgi:hypothetical protein
MLWSATVASVFSQLWWTFESNIGAKTIYLKKDAWMMYKTLCKMAKCAIISEWSIPIGPENVVDQCLGLWKLAVGCHDELPKNVHLVEWCGKL